MLKRGEGIDTIELAIKEGIMKKLFTYLTLLCLCLSMVVGCGSSKKKDDAENLSNLSDMSLGEMEGVEDINTTNDLLIRHEVFKIGGNEYYDEYMIIYYGSTSGVLKGMTDEAHYSKNSNVTMDRLNALDVSTVYRGFNEMSFASKTVTEESDYYLLQVKFRDLDNEDNMEKMVNNGLIRVNSGNGHVMVKADSFIQSFEAAGYEKVSMLDYTKLDLHFDY